MIDSLLSKADRFWDNVLVGPDDECWPWVGRTDPKGYGLFVFQEDGQRYTYKAHRASYMIFHRGTLSDRSILLHECDNPQCVNPHHLTPGTRTENNKDRDEKGRTAKGEKHGRAKLTLVQVREIRAKLEQGQGIRALAREYNVDKKIIQKIRDKEIWVE